MRLYAATVFVAVSITSCSRLGSPEAVYLRAQSAYIAGNLEEAAATASGGAAHWSGDPKSPWYWKFRLLNAEVLNAQSKTKEAENLLRHPVPPIPALAQLEVRRLIDLAAASPRESAEMLRKAAAAATDPELQIRIKVREGIMSAKGSDAGESSFRAALAIADRVKNTYWQSYALSLLCYSTKTEERYEESLDFGLRALAAAGQAGARGVAAMAHGNLGSVYAYLGEFELAYEHQQKAADISSKIGVRSGLMTALGELGLLYDREAQYPKAIDSYKRAYDIAVELNSKSTGSRLAQNLSLTYLKSEQLDAAKEWNQRAFTFASSEPSLQYLLPGIERNRALIAFGQGHVDEAARICEELLKANGDQADIRWSVYDLLGKIDVARKQYSKADKEFEAALTIIDGIRSDLSAPNRISLLSRLMPFYQDYVEALVDQNKDEDALRVMESSRARVLSERLGRNLKPEQFPNKAALTKFARATNSSLLSFWFTSNRSFAWLICPGGVQRFDLPPVGEVEAMVSRYRNVVEHAFEDPIATNNADAAALWKTLLADIAPHIPKGSRLIVIPDGPLHRLNLETMINPSPSPHYWIEDVAIAIAPSIPLAVSKLAAAPRRAPSLLLIGAPEYGSDYTPLPKAAVELSDIQSHFAGAAKKVDQGPQASPAAYAQAGPAGFSLIHFAAHAEVNPEMPLESAIILSRQGGQNKLYARDVIDIPINADLVTISACRSAAGRTYAGEGLIGFAWAFLQAGAHNVVAGLWDVSDTSTEALMNRFYGGLSAGQDPVTALQNAKLALLKGDMNYRNPFYWAPFQTYVGSAVQ
jgi:CHAT domain-containing protein